MFQDDIGRESFQRLAHESLALALLEARYIDRFDRGALPRQRVGERQNRRRVAGKINGAVEDDQRARFARIVALRRLIAACSGKSDGLARGAAPHERIRIIEKARKVFRATAIEIGPDPRAALRVERRREAQPRILDPVPGTSASAKFFARANLCELLDAIGPVVLAAEQPRDDDPRVRPRTFSK